MYFVPGCILGFPILGTDIELHDLRVCRGTSPPMIIACVAQCIYKAVSKASPVLFEPFMDLEVTSVLVHLNLLGYIIYFSLHVQLYFLK